MNGVGRWLQGKGLKKHLLEVEQMPRFGMPGDGAPVLAVLGAVGVQLIG